MSDTQVLTYVQYSQKVLLFLFGLNLNEIPNEKKCSLVICLLPLKTKTILFEHWSGVCHHVVTALVHCGKKELSQ